jgi:ATP-dependent Clp protease adaptor protein ClpS
MSPTTVPTPTRKLRPEEEQKTRRQPPYHVILLNDNDHSYDYVIRMLKELFGHPEERGYQLAKEVDERGRAIVLTTSLELAELKRDQIHAYGPDPLIPRCQGSMTAEIEPAPE